MNKKIQKANKVGRPTKYNDGMIDRANDYIQSCGRESTELPTIEGLALTLQVDDTTLLSWAEKNPKFLATIKNLKFKQKNQLINDGLYGGKEINAAMAIFLLKANHGMIETERKEITGVNGQPFTIQVGQGYIPANTVIDATSIPSDAKQFSEVQDAGVAQESKENNHSNI